MYAEAPLQKKTPQHITGNTNGKDVTKPLHRTEVTGENDALQLKRNPLQKQAAPEEEDPLQMKSSPIQLEGGLEEEDPLQMKENPVQLQPGFDEEEDAAQMKKGPVQRIEGEEEEPLQMKQNPLQQKATGQNPLQPKTSTQNPLRPIRYDNPFQRKEADSPAQQPKKENNTGLPDNLKAGVESLSGYSMDDVKVHYNSDKPAQLQALAYAQGTDIHIAPGQEQHLPHEAWHVVQQKQRRVQPTVQTKQGVAVNDDKGLESEADVMGKQAARMSSLTDKLIVTNESANPSIQKKGERNAVSATATTNGAGTTNQIRRGNRRGSISLTNGDSRSKLAAFRYYAYPPTTNAQRLNKLKTKIVQAANNKGIPNADAWYNDNYDRIVGYAAQVTGIGNCGEFGSAVFGELMQNTTNQFVAKCSMYPNSKYDHCFVLTLPQSVPAGATLPSNVDTDTATIADGWDGHKVMTLQQFFNGENAYGDTISFSNIWVSECKPADGTDHIQNIRADIEAFANEFTAWYNIELAKPNSQLSKIAQDAKAAADSPAAGVAGMFGTEGSDKAPLQDIRPMKNKLEDLDVPQAEKDTLVTGWWNNLTDEDITTFSAGAINEFKSVVNAHSLDVDDLTQVKINQYLDILPVNDAIDEMNLLDDTKAFGYLNTKTKASKPQYINGLNTDKVKTYINASWSDAGFWAVLSKFPYKSDVIAGLSEMSFKSYIKFLSPKERGQVSAYFSAAQKAWTTEIEDDENDSYAV